MPPSHISSANSSPNDDISHSILNEIKSQLVGCHGLKLAHINVCSLLPKLDEIRFLILSLDLDVLCISETWLHEQIPNHEIIIDGYDVIRKDRLDKRGGGVCMYVKNSILVKDRCELTSQFEIETVLIEVYCKKVTVLISCIYRPPTATVTFFDDCSDMLEKILMDDKELIILGDFNVDYCSNPNSSIHSLECLFSLHQLVNKPTRVTINSSTCIDLILTTMPENHSVCDVGQISLSDHYMVFTCVDIDAKNTGHKMVNFRDYSDFNQDEFIEDLCNCELLCDPNALSDMTCDVIWLNWVNAFLKTCDRHAPIKSVRVKNRYNPWINSEIITAMYKRDFLKRKAMNDATLLHEYRKQRNAVISAIRKAKAAYFSTISVKYRNDPKKLWKELHRATGNSKFVNNVHNDLTPDEFNDYFAQVGKKISDSFQHEPLKWRNPPCLHKFKFSEILGDDVLKLLNNLPSHSNLDILNIDCKMLKIAAPFIVHTLTEIFNFSLKSGFVFENWKYARVTPIYKGKGEKDVPSNYRPISVVSHLAKIQEKLVQTQFISYLRKHELITIEQSAFLMNHSTVTSLHRVVDDWHAILNDHEVVAVCFFDISKCFDTISHELLILKLQYYGVHDTELDWFKSYLSGRQQSVNLNGKLSNPRGVTVGIPQGGVLGPILFLIFINDIVQSVNAGTCNIFADDVAIYTNGNNIKEAELKLQVCVNEIGDWYKNNRLKINADKTNVMLITSRKHDSNELNVSLNGTSLRQVDTVRYLGLNIDSRLTWTDHVKQLCKNLSYKVFSLRRLSNTLSTPLLNTLYKSTIQPCIDYACSVWGNCSSKTRELIHRIQRRAARIVSKKYGARDISVTELIKDLKWQTFETRRDYFLCMLMYQCIHGTAPVRLCNEIEMYFDRHGFNTRNANSLNVVAPKPSTEMFKQSFTYAGPKTWNSLDDEIKNSHTLTTFKTLYKLKHF